MFLELAQLQVRYAGAERAAVQDVSFGLQAGDIGVLKAVLAAARHSVDNG